MRASITVPAGGFTPSTNTVPPKREGGVGGDCAATSVALIAPLKPNSNTPRAAARPMPPSHLNMLVIPLCSIPVLGPSSLTLLPYQPARPFWGRAGRLDRGLVDVGHN